MGAHTGSPRILVVEDDLAIGETLCELLREEGFDVAWAENGREALDRLRRGRLPGVILLDLMMPVMDGWQFRTAQRGDPELARIPVIVLSADHALGQKLPGLGVNSWLPKPFEFGELLRAIREVSGGAADRDGADGSLASAHTAV